MSFLCLAPPANPPLPDRRPALQFSIFQTSDNQIPGMPLPLKGAHLVLINYSMHISRGMAVVLEAKGWSIHPTSHFNLCPEQPLPSHSMHPLTWQLLLFSTIYSFLKNFIVSILWGVFWIFQQIHPKTCISRAILNWKEEKLIDKQLDDLRRLLSSQAQPCTP